MSQRCDICQGRGTIKLPVYREPEWSVSSAALAAEVVVYAKDFPCPQCSKDAGVPDDRLAIVKFGGAISTIPENDPRYKEAMRKQISRQLVDVILEKGFVRFSEGKEDKFEMRRELRGVIGVVAPTQVATMEQRIAERQGEVAEKVALVARHFIRQWGSDYSGPEGNISKAQAISAVEEALAKVLHEAAQPQ